MNAGPSAAAPAKTFGLRQASVPRVLFALLHQRFTGTLTLTQPAPHAGVRTVWLEGGMPVFTDWVEPGDVLGQVLLRERAIAPQALEQALARLATQGGLLGQTLLAEGLLAPEMLADGLATQCMAKLVHAFALRDGEGTITSEAHAYQGMVRVNVLELVQRGIAVHYDQARIELEMKGELMGPLRATSAFGRYRGHFGFAATDDPVLDALVHGSSLSQVIGLGAPVLRSAQLVYTLWACQMLRVGTAATFVATTQATDATMPATTQATDATMPATTQGTDASKSPPPPQTTAASKPATPPQTVGASNPPPPPRPTPASKPPAPTPAVAAHDHDPSPDPPLTEASLLPEIEAFEAKLTARAHAFDLLGVSIDAERKDIRAAWAELSRRMHPDRLQGHGLSHLRPRVNQVFAALSEAHALLSDKDQRETLRARLQRGEDPTAADADANALARAAFESELIAKDADRLLKASRFDRALDRYHAALALTPDEPDLQAAVAWCHYCLSPRAPADALAAEKTLTAVLARSPNLARAHYFRGLVLRDAKSTDAALLAFELALRHDERLIDAERQARVIRAAKMQTQAEARKPRGLKGLFGKR